MRLLTKEEFVSRARKIHNKKYTYNKVIYKGNHIKIIITCPIHGDFEQQPYAHLAGTDEAVSKGYVDETIQQNLNTTLEGIIKFVSMTEAEYKALETKSPSTIYHLTDVSMWAIGDQEIVTSNMPA